MRSVLYIAWLSLCLMGVYSSLSPEDVEYPMVTERDSEFRKDYSLDVEEGGWYKLHRIPDTWDNARIRCELEGAELASPLDSKISDHMLSMINHVGLASIFTGIHSLFSNGEYFSLNGVSIEEMPIYQSSELSSNKNQRCTAFQGGTIYNVNCDIKLPYICYKKKDYTYLTECGTIDTEYTLNKQLNTCYKLHKDRKSWKDAFKTCSAEGGALAVIDSDAEFAAVIQLFNNHTDSRNNLEYQVYIGILYWQHTGQWKTIYDTTVEKSGFSTWSPQLLNKYTSYYFCGALRRSGLTKTSCLGAPFVCEKKPKIL